MTDDNKKHYLVYGPNLGAELHTFSEALEKEKTELREGQKEDPSLHPLYAPQSGQALPPKHPCFEGKPTLPGKSVEQLVPFGKTSVPRDRVSRPPSEDEAAAFAKIWKAIDKEENQPLTDQQIEAERERESYLYWGFLGGPEDLERTPRPEWILTFEEVYPQFGYKTVRALNKLAEKLHYPEKARLKGLITETGCRLLKDKRQAARHTIKMQSAQKCSPKSKASAQGKGVVNGLTKD